MFIYRFPHPGIYKILINFKKALYDMSSIFTIFQLKKLKFLPGFDSLKVTDMSHFFSDGIEEIDLNYLKTDNVISMNGMFKNSYRLISIDLSKFNTSKVKNMRELFPQNFYLKYVDLISFDTSNITLCQSLFYENIVNIEIKISNKFINCLEYIPKAEKIISIDELACQNVEHCQKCTGSKENLLCAACKLGYYLKENKCIKSNCIIWENEKCHNCSFMTENECLTCNIGYYLLKKIVINQNEPNAKQKDVKYVMILVEIVKNVSNFISLFLMRKPLK